MKRPFSFPVKFISFCTVLVFGWNQTVFAEGVTPYENYPNQPVPLATPIESVVQNTVPPQELANTSTDFLLNADSPLSLAEDASQETDSNKVYGAAGELRSERSLEGRMTRHVYEGESIQEALDQSVSGDTVFVHAGTYHQKLVLQQGLNLKGEDAQTTVIHGDFQTGSHVIRALGANRIECLTVSGGGAYAGTPSSAIRVEGDNVKIRRNRILDNRDYGIFVWQGAATLIEMNFFKATHVGVQLPKDTTVIRHNTFVKNDIAVNVLSGARASIWNNLFTESTFASIYEFNWAAYSSGQPSRGFAAVENNTVWKNTERGTYYGSATPPAVENQTAGNLKADPGFVNVSAGDYRIRPTASSYGRGAFLPGALEAALDRVSTISAQGVIRNITNGEAVIGYQVLYEEGSTEEFYNDGRTVLDTTPPQIVLASDDVFINQQDYELVYSVDGVEKREALLLAEGQNDLMIEVEDIFGNKTVKIAHVTLDRTPPAGVLRVNAGDEETDSRVVVLSVEAQDSSPLREVRFSVDGGIRWIDWEAFSGMKVVMLSEGEGLKEVLCQLRDAAGNVASFSDTIRFATAPVRPVVQFLSPSFATDPVYLLRYSVDGVEHQETWRLQPGENRLMVCATSGASPAFDAYVVAFDRTEGVLPAMPSAPALPPDLVSLTAQNGLVLKYADGDLFAIEQPGAYTVFDITLDAGKNLLGGMLLFTNGDRLLFQDGKPLYRLSSLGEKTVYNEDGTVAYVLTPDNKKIRFVYQLDPNGKILAILSYEDTATSLYDVKGRPVWVQKTDGTAIFYEDGFLTAYVDAAGNVFRYEVSILHEGTELSGYRSALVSVTRAGTSTAIPIDVITADPSPYPAVKTTLEEELSAVIDYGPAGDIKKVISGSGEILELQNGLPASFTNAAGELLTVQSEISEDRDLFLVTLGGDAIEQIYDASARLNGIRLSDGTLFRVTGSTLRQIALSDGSALQDLTWNGNQLTGFTRTQPNGFKEVYWNSRIIYREDAHGTVTSFIDARPDTIRTGDGRTYTISEYFNGQGVPERLTVLSSIVWPDGSRVEFEHGTPVRYVYNVTAAIEPEDLPEFETGRFFIPQIDLYEAQLRALTVDENGTIFSGQILFRDGTQYFIEGEKIVAQVTATGQRVEFPEERLPPAPLQPSVPAEPLTAAESIYRDQLIETQWDYFVAGKGLHAGTGLPVDNYTGLNGQQSDYSQATLVGFWAEILASIAAGDYVVGKMSRPEAFEKLKALLDTYREVQEQVGWNGMVAFFKIMEGQEPVLDGAGVPTGEMRTVYRYENCFNQHGFGDALNLAVSLASVIGALESLALEPDLGSSRDAIVSRAREIMAAQEPGYAAFYDPEKKRFHGAYGLNRGTGQWEFVENYYIDRVFNEFRTGMVWLAAQYPQYREALENLDIAIRPFQTREGETIDMAPPYDGGAFQMFWPLIHVDETQFPEFEVALRNFLYAQAEFADTKGLPGLLSAGDVPRLGYQGKIGMPGAAETDDLLRTDTGSVYGTAGAFPLAPHYALQFLKNMESCFPGMRTGAGFVDAIQLQQVIQEDPQTGDAVSATVPVYSDQYYGVDQASFILSLLKTSQNYFENYLERTGALSSFESLYQGLSFKLSPVVRTNPAPPDFGENTPSLYAGASSAPDGLSAGLIKQQSFVPVLRDPEWGDGRVFNYLTPSGKFHHIEVEFGEGDALRRINLQEYCLSPKHAGSATALLGALERDILNGASSQGVFFTPGAGRSVSMLDRDPGIGEVRHLEFKFLSAWKPVGIWANYEALDLSAYDFLSVPVKLAPGTPENVRLKFEFKGMGEVFLTGALSHDWQYISIPIPKSAGALDQLAISIQPLDGNPVAGDLYLGPLSALKVRTSNEIHWELLLGIPEAEIRTLIQQKIVSQRNGGSGYAYQETLENFTVDADGKLLNGVLKRADGGIQYFQNGQLVKWIFRNGRTVLFENGLATFLLDLARGRLETGRFYYDQSFRGEIRSFILQENDSKKIFDADGELKTWVEDGYFLHFQDGEIQSLETGTATLTGLEFLDDGNLAKAHVALAGGGGFDIDQTGEQGTDVGGGVKVFYQEDRIAAIETPQNGKTYFIYYRDPAGGSITDAFAQFPETVTDPQTGTSTTTYQFMNLSEYIQRPERVIEKTHILEGPPVNVLERADSVAGFSAGALPAGEITQGLRGDFGEGAMARYQFRYQSLEGPALGISAKHLAAPVPVEDYDFLTLTIKKDPSMDWDQTLQLTLKTSGQTSLYSFQVSSTGSDYQTFEFPLAHKAGAEAEVTLEVLRQPAGVGKTGAFFIKDISYLALKKIDHPLWEGPAGILASKLKSLRIASTQLTSVGAEIASKSPVVYAGLAALLNTPTLLRSQENTGSASELVHFNRFDGTQVELAEGNIRRMILPDGTVNEYETSPNASEGTVAGPGGTSGEGGTILYRYGALRKITQADGREYLLSYEFDSEGQEITVFKDVLSGEERRFRDGKLFSASDPNRLQTRYAYENGTLTGAQMTYNNRVLNSTQYAFLGDGTQVTDERGTTWFYDANGDLIKHLTEDGYLYEYSDYTQAPGADAGFSAGDLSARLFTATGLRAVNLIGYESPDGSQVLYDFRKNGTGEVNLAGGGHGVNLSFDPDQNIKSGQIQFPDGQILEIENYIPIRGRFAGGQLFGSAMPQAETYELLYDDQDQLTGFRLKAGEWFFSYDPAGRLSKVESLGGMKHAFTYGVNSGGEVTDYTRVEHSQIAFNGVPFPKEISLVAESTQKLLDEAGQEVARHEGDGFLAAIYKAGLNQWDLCSGSFGSAGDRATLKNFLLGVKAGEHVSMVVSDRAFSQIDNETVSLLEGLGSGQVRMAAAANPKWTFLGAQGLGFGKGREKTGASFFSTVEESTERVPVAGEGDVLFLNMPLFLNIPSSARQAYAQFLERYRELKALPEMQGATVYDAQGEIVYTNRIDGMKAYYESGKIRETYNAAGDLVAVHAYECLAAEGCLDPADAVLKKITLVKARSDFEAESRRLQQQIEQTKFDALYRLAGQDEAARLQIKESVESGVGQISSQIAAMQAQRFRKVKVCKRFLFWKTCHEETFEVPGVQEAINQLAAQRSELVATGEAQLAGIPGAVASKKAEIEQATAEKMQELEQKKQEFLRDVLRQEMEPVLTDLFRRILGRDASKQEFETWVDRSKDEGQLDIAALQSELRNSSEKAVRETQKASLIQEVQDFLNGYLADPPETKTQRLQTLGLDPSETVDLTSEDVEQILDWLRSRDLHFGQSAFLSLQEMLASKGVEVPMEVIAREAILIDILTGVIHRFSEGDLLISLFALDRVAAIQGQDFSAVKYTFEDLRETYRSACGMSPGVCGLRMIAHIGEDHFVVLEKVTDTEVTYRETGKGNAGESVTISKEQFLKVWGEKGGAGHLLVSDDQVLLEKKLSDQEAMKIRGAFLFIFFFIASLALTAASMVVSIFSPAFGKILGYAALVAGIIGIVAGLGGFVVQGVRSVFSAITSQNIFATIKQGFLSAGKMLWDSVSYVGRFFQNGFVFLKEGFTGGLNALGSGLIHVKDFLLAPAQAVIKNGVTTGYEFSFAQNAARQLVAAGLTLGVSKGLAGLGLDPRLTQLASVFVGGGFLGLGSASSSFIRSGLQHLALQGVSQVALHTGLAPPFANVLSLVTTQSLAAFFDPELTLRAGLTQIVPSIASQLTSSGLDLLGRSLGFDPRLSRLLGLPFAAITGDVVGAFLGSDPFDLDPSGISGLIKDALLSRETMGGVFSLAASFVMDRLDLADSLWGSLSSRLIGGIFSDFLASPTRFDAVESIIKSVDESFYHFLDPAMLPELFDAIQDLGLVDGIEAYATDLFTRETLMEFTSAGMNLRDWLEHGIPVAEDIVHEGESAKRVRLTQKGKTIVFVYVPKGARLEIRKIFEEDENGHTRRLVQWDTDAEGRITQVLIEEQMGGGVIRRDVLDPDGRVKEILFKDWAGEAYGRMSFNEEGAIEFTNYALGISSHLAGDGRFTFHFNLAPDLQDLDSLLYNFNANLQPGDVAQLAAFTFGNGFWNSHESPDSISMLMGAFIEDMNKDQAVNGTPGIVLFDAAGNIARDRHGNILTTGSLPVTLYEETSLVGNVFKWMADTWFGCNFMRDEIERELTRYFDLVALNQREFGLDPPMSFVHFAHSGNFQPMIEALEHMDNEYRSRIKTLVVYEGPYAGDGIIDDPFLETLVRVRGVISGPAVPLLEHRDFQITDQEGRVTALPNQYNIEIVGAGHSDFSYDPVFNYASSEAREIARKTSLFMRELTMKSDDIIKLKDFIDVDRLDGSIEKVDGVYRINITKFQSELDDGQ